MALSLFAGCQDGPVVPSTDAETITLVQISGDDQTGVPGEELANPLVVRATDEKGHAIRGALLNFVVTQGGGSVWAGSSLTDRRGYARDYWRLGVEPGENRVEVRMVEPITGERLVFGEFVAWGVVPPVPTPEVCDGTDNDLDGAVDEELAYCTGGTPAPNTDGEQCLEGWSDLDGQPENGCEISDQAYEALPVTVETVEAAVDVITEGRIDVPPSCGGSATLNCENGMPGPVAQLDLARTALEITTISQGVYGFTAQVTVATVSDIKVTIDSGTGPITCDVRVNSTLSGAPTVEVAGTATFMSHTPGGPTDRLDLAVSTSGLDDDDVQILGGFSCALAGAFMSIYKDLVMDMIGTTAVHLCGAPGPELFVNCEDPADLSIGTVMGFNSRAQPLGKEKPEQGGAASRWAAVGHRRMPPTAA